MFVETAKYTRHSSVFQPYFFLMNLFFCFFIPYFLSQKTVVAVDILELFLCCIPEERTSDQGMLNFHNDVSLSSEYLFVE